MPVNQSCSSGTEVTNEVSCREAQNWASELGLTPKRNLQPGSWGEDGVPYQCSAQVGNDDALHFNTNSQANDSGLTTGEYVMICFRDDMIGVSLQGLLLLDFVIITNSAPYPAERQQDFRILKI